MPQDVLPWLVAAGIFGLLVVIQLAVRAKKPVQRAAGGGLVVLRGCGHFAFLDDPVRFRMIAEAFLFGKG